MAAHDCLEFDPPLFASSTGFVGLMNSVPRQQRFGRDESAGFPRSKEPLPIEAEVQTLIERPDNLPGLSRPEDARLIDKVNRFQQSLAERRHPAELCSSRPVVEHFAP